jgi:Tol biopolymer transport system component
MNLTSGTKLGPYEIVSLLGAGGMGEVYRARDSRLKREVAIKVLPKALSLDPDRLRRFEQEALATAALNHPNILAVFDIGSHDGAPYVVSELLEGETLRERLRSGAIPLRKSLDYALQIAHGLAAAHEKGIVHRDLKPENLFVTRDGRVKILDFGLAKLTQPEASSHTSLPTMTHVTEAGTVMGTAGYMSPEQVRGVAVDARSDIFSFGTILYEIISGKRAFHGETPADTMSAILKEEPGDLSETNRNVSPALERIVHHCLEKNPEQRFHSASDIAFDLEHLSGTTGTGARIAADTAHAPDRRRIAAFAGAAFVALSMPALGWWIGHGRGPAPLAEYKQITFRTGSMGKARFAPDGSVIYSAAWEGGDSQLYMARADDPGSRDLGLKNAELLAVSKNGELAIRLNTAYYTGFAVAGTLARVPLSGGMPREVLERVQDADWSPNGDALTVVRSVPENNHWRLEYPIGKTLFESIDWISEPRISPDGKWIAFGDHENVMGDDEGSVSVIAADGSDNGKLKKLSSGWASVEGIAWSPKGDEVWFCASKTGSALNPQGVTLSGKLRTIANVPGGLWLEDVRNGTALAITHRDTIGIRGVAPGSSEERELGWFGWSIAHGISPDGHKIIFEEEGNGGGANYTAFVRDTDGSPPIRIGEGMPKAISPDSRWVITVSAKGGPLTLVPTGAGEARQLTHDSVSYGNMRWTADGKHLLAVGIEAGHGQRDYLIDVATGDSHALTPDGIVGVHISPDGKTVAVRAPDKKLGMWPLDGSGLRIIPGIDSNSYFIDGWSPDGSSIYVHSSRKEPVVNIYKVNVTTGKMELWKTFGEKAAGLVSTSGPMLSDDNRAYAYIYSRVLSEAYVVTGLQ